MNVRSAARPRTAVIYHSMQEVSTHPAFQDSLAHLNFYASQKFLVSRLTSPHQAASHLPSFILVYGAIFISFQVHINSVLTFG